MVVGGNIAITLMPGDESNLLAFQNHVCNRLLLSVGKREMSALAAESRGKLCRLTVKLHNGTLTGQPRRF